MLHATLNTLATVIKLDERQALMLVRMDMLNFFPALLMLDDANLRMSVLEILVYFADARGYIQVCAHTCTHTLSSHKKGDMITDHYQRTIEVALTIDNTEITKRNLPCVCIVGRA